jgi:hypothetical protein
LASELEAWATVVHAPLVPTGPDAKPWYSLDGLRTADFDMLVRTKAGTGGKTRAAA